MGICGACGIYALVMENDLDVLTLLPQPKDTAAGTLCLLSSWEFTSFAIFMGVLL